ncbi:hypothetical protein CC79DRAFT_1399986 [Sarocladium strictum]
MSSLLKGAVQAVYSSNLIPIPPEFLAKPPDQTPASRPLRFAEHGFTEYDGKVAFVIDNVLSHPECKQLIQLAEESVPRPDSEASWKPAMVALGKTGWEVPAPGYRESDRIIWDEQKIADRIFARCLLAKGVRVQLQSTPPVNGYRHGRWDLVELNKRLRFYKYSKNQFFKPHTDLPFGQERDGKEFRTHYTLYLYLNDSIAESSANTLDLIGGATAFISRDRKRKLNVSPKVGSVLIFQHHGLRHEESAVTSGTKYTMRGDILYEWVPGEIQERVSRPV